MLVGYLAIVFEASPQEEYAIIINIMMEMMIDILAKIYRPASIIGEGNGHPLQYSCLENLRNRGAWWAAVHGITKSWTHLSMHAYKSQRGGTRNGNPKVAVYFFECLTSASPRFCLTPSFTVSSGKATWALTLHHCTVLASKGHIPVCEASILNCHKRV